MRHEQHCPTCGATLSLLQGPKPLHRCSACNRTNPAGFRYCGHCAAPIETTEVRARLSAAAAPDGGWPSLARELVELRFFLQQGQFDDAYEMLAILQRRNPGHPELEEFVRRPQLTHDRDVVRVVEQVLAESSSLSSRKAPRRAAVRWDAPAAEFARVTAAHGVLEVSREELEELISKSVDDIMEDAEPATPTRVYRALRPEQIATQSGHTVVVDALQPPTPFEGPFKGGSEGERPPDPSIEATPRRRRGGRFGAAVLDRLGEPEQATQADPSAARIRE